MDFQFIHYLTITRIMMPQEEMLYLLKTTLKIKLKIFNLKSLYPSKEMRIK